MRTMVKFTIPTQEANPLVKDGSIGQTMESLMGHLQPEAAYFGPIEGKRGGFIGRQISWLSAKPPRPALLTEGRRR